MVPIGCARSKHSRKKESVEEKKERAIKERERATKKKERESENETDRRHLLCLETNSPLIPDKDISGNSLKARPNDS